MWWVRYLKRIREHYREEYAQYHVRYQALTLDEFYGPAATKVKRVKKIPHAILLHGPSGCGKTTLAEILANRLYEDYCNKWKKPKEHENYWPFPQKEPMVFREYPYLHLEAGTLTTPKDITAAVSGRWMGNEAPDIRIIHNVDRFKSKLAAELLDLLDEADLTDYYFLCTTKPNKISKSIRKRCREFGVAPLNDKDMTKLLLRVIGEERLKVGKELRERIVAEAKGNPREALKLLQEGSFYEENEDVTLAGALEKWTTPCYEFRVKRLPRPVKLMKPWLEEASLTLLAGGTGKGKTLLSMEIASAVADGRGAMGGVWPVDQAEKVLYVDGEMHWADIKKYSRYLKSDNLHMASRTFFEYLGMKEQINLADEECRKVIADFVLKKKYKLLILDNLAALTWGISFRSSEDYSALNQWLLYFRSKGVAVILVHHTRKNDDDQYGTITKVWAVNQYILLEPVKKKDGSALWFTLNSKKEGRQKSLGLDGLLFNFDDGNWIVTDSEGTKQESQEQKELRNKRIATMLRRGIQQKKIAEKVGVSKGRITQIKKELKEKGLV